LNGHEESDAGRRADQIISRFRIMPVSEIASPCISVCDVDREKGMCANCGRTLDQIVSWSSLEPTEREEIMGELEDAGYPEANA